MIKVGCCGFARGKPEYFRQFKLVEIQQTFYKMPRRETAIKWRAEAPPDFEFTLKAWQLITHPTISPTYRRAGIKIPMSAEEGYGFFRPTNKVHQAWEDTRNFAQALRAKIIIFQCPPSFKETLENINNMKKFFKSIQDSGFLRVWEPRGDWNVATVKSLCAELELIHCVDPYEKESLYGEPKYFRLHGGPGYRHRYSEEELHSLKDKIGKRDAYALFNNLNMYEDALTFQRLAREEK